MRENALTSLPLGKSSHDLFFLFYLKFIFRRHWLLDCVGGIEFSHESANCYSRRYQESTEFRSTDHVEQSTKGKNE